MKPCLTYTGSKRNGYGLKKIRLPDGRGSTKQAHRYVWEGVHGPTEGHVDHLCRNRACVRLEHLEAVKPGENTRRAWAFRERHPTCPTCGNSDWYIRPDRGHRECRICRNPSSRRVQKMVRGADDAATISEADPHNLLDPHHREVLEWLEAHPGQDEVIGPKELDGYIASCRGDLLP